MRLFVVSHKLALPHLIQSDAPTATFALNVCLHRIRQGGRRTVTAIKLEAEHRSSKQRERGASGRGTTLVSTQHGYVVLGSPWLLCRTQRLEMRGGLGVASGNRPSRKDRWSQKPSRASDAPNGGKDIIYNQPISV